MMTIIPTLYDIPLSDKEMNHQTTSLDVAKEIFTYFKNNRLFDWNDSHNGCEGRADAVCVLLEEWGIPNFKGWVFGGTYLKKGHIGELTNNWKYHVAAVLPVLKDGKNYYYVIDPATSKELPLIEDWSAAITAVPHSYYCIRKSCWYIFPETKISIETWHPRNHQNRKWMIQCLLGINSMTKKGKAQLVFKKQKIANMQKAFNALKLQKPNFDDR